MKNTKNIKFIVNLVDVDPNTVYIKFVQGKVRAGIPITEVDYRTIYNSGVIDSYKMIYNSLDDIVDAFMEMNNDKLTTVFDNIMHTVEAVEKKNKAPWYKRLWNTIKRPFTRKK